MKNSIMFTSEARHVTITLTTLIAFLTYLKSLRLIVKIPSGDLRTTRSENTLTTATSITTQGTCHVRKPMNWTSILKEKREVTDSRRRSHSLKNTLIMMTLLSLAKEGNDFSNSRFNSSKYSNRPHENFNSCKPSLPTAQWPIANLSPTMICSETSHLIK